MTADQPTVVIATVPWTDTKAPLMAPAVLKANLAHHGIASCTIDLNAEVRRYIESHDHYDSILKFFLTEQVDRNAKGAVMEILHFMADRLLAYHPTWILLSLLTYLSQNATRWLCLHLRQINPQVKIVIGGPGASISLTSFDNYAKTLQSQNLIDHFITGDGEISVVKLLQGHHQYAGIDNHDWQQLPDLNNQPVPDFSDYDWSLYQTKRILIVGSRGCVRECTFCDIHEHWSSYQWRSGQDIFREIQQQIERHGINIFSFSDSLVNGNQKEFRVLLELMADHNKKRPTQQIRWTGSCIVRPRQQMKEDVWRLVAESGAIMLNLGVESFVEHIRYHIKKKFSNDDLDFALRMGQKHNIPLTLLTIVGYAIESRQDFEQQLAWVRQNRHYAGNTVKMVQIGSGLGILPNTWLDRNKTQLGIIMPDSEVKQDWTNPGIDSTPMVRMQWHKEMCDTLRENGFQVDYLKDNHELIESYINDKYQS